MHTDESPSRLSRIDTLWSIVQRAHGDDLVEQLPAQQQLLDLYGSAIKRYLLAATRNEDVADDLFQQFAVKFINGDFKSADPNRGQFRSFVKTVLARMIALHYRKRKTRRERSWGEGAEPAADSISDPNDQTFVISWREDLLARTWQRLADHEHQTGVRYNTVLRMRVAEPGLDGREFARNVARTLGKPMEPGAVRVMVHRAREKFATLLTTTVAESLGSRRRDVVEAELIELGLIDYCREALDGLPTEA